MQQILLLNHCCLNLSPEAINQATNRFSSKKCPKFARSVLNLNEQFQRCNLTIFKQTTKAIDKKTSDKKGED